MRGIESGGGSGKPAARRKKPSKVPATPQVLAPKPSGVFADATPRPQKVDGGRARRNVQKAEEALPTPTLPVRRYPDLAKPTHKQAQTIVRGQREALRGSSVAAKQDAGAGNADRLTRAQIGIANRAEARLAHDRLVRVGVDEVRRNPGRYAWLRAPDAPGLTAPDIAIRPPERIHGKVRGPLRDALAAVGAEKVGSMRPGVRAKARAPHGTGKGLSIAIQGAIHLDAGKVTQGAAIAAAGATHAAERAVEAATRGAGGGEGSLIRNLGRDLVRFPYDAVNAGYQVSAAFSDELRKLPKPLRIPASVLATPLGLPAGVAATASDKPGSGARARRLAGALDDGVIGALAGGHVGLAGERFHEHPLYGALEFSGAYGAVGRGVGAAGRAGLLGSKLKAATRDLSRPDLAVSVPGRVSIDGQEVIIPGARSLRVNRRASKNAITQLVQRKVFDARPRTVGGAVRAEDSLVPGVGALRARRVKNRATDEFADVAQVVSRGQREAQRTDALNAAGRITRLTHRARAEANHERIMQGIVATRAMTRREVQQVAQTEGAAGVARLAASVGVKVRLSGRDRAAAAAGRVRPAIATALDSHVPTRLGASVPFSSQARYRYLRPERDLLGDVAEVKLGDRGNFRQRLGSEISRLEQAFADHHGDMNLTSRRNNRDRVRAMRALEGQLAHPNAKVRAKAAARVEQLFSSAEAVRRLANRTTRASVAAELLTQGQADQARLRSFAVTELGLRHDPTKAPTDADAAVHEMALAGRRESALEVRAAQAESAAAAMEHRDLRIAVARRRAQRRAVVVKPGEALRGDLPVHQRTRARNVLAFIDRVESGAVSPQKLGAMKRAEARDAAALKVAEGVRRQKAQALKDRIKALRGAKELVHETSPRHFVRGLVRYEPPTPADLARAAQLEKLAENAARGAAGQRATGAYAFGGGNATQLDRVAKEAAAEAAQLRQGRTTKVTLEDIRREYRDRYGSNAQMPAFLSHRPDAQGSGAYFVNWLTKSFNRKGADSFRRTGEAARQGTHGATQAATIDALVHAQGVLSAAQNWDRFIRGFGIAPPKDFKGGKLFQWDEAEQYAQAIREGWMAEIGGAPTLVPVRVGPGRYGEDRLERILAGQDPVNGAVPVGILSKRLKDLWETPPPPHERATRNVVLVDAEVLHRFSLHQGGTKFEHTKAAQAITNAFRNTVLPTSLKWLTGNVVEAIFRSAMWGVVPIADQRLGRRVLRDLLEQDAALGEVAAARMTSGLNYGTAQRYSIHRDKGAFTDTSLEAPARAAAVVRNAPGLKQTVDVYMAFARRMFSLNRQFEQMMQAGVVGKELRAEMQASHGWVTSWQDALRLQGEAYDGALAGLAGDAKQVQFARAVDKVLGQYVRFSPQMRAVIQNVAPFLPWYLNAVRFIYHDLPVRHPVKAGLLGLVERALDADMTQQAGARPPGDLGAAIAMPDGGYLPIARYLPVGVITPLGRDFPGAGSHPEELVSPLLPQFSTAGLNLFGLDFAGRALKTDDGSTPNRTAIAINSFAEGLVPLLQFARRVREGGQTGYSNSTVVHPRTKQNTAHGRTALERILVPWTETYLQASAGSGLPTAPARAHRPSIDEQVAGALAGGDDAAAAAAQQAIDAEVARALAGP